MPGKARRRFPVRYTEADVALPAEVDRAHERLSGPATRHILQREHQKSHKKEFVRLAGISPSHTYNLRRSPFYRNKTVGFDHTRPAGVSIAERKRRDPKGMPGYIRIDICYRCWKRFCISFPSKSSTFIRTTDRSSSTIRWRECWKICWSSSRNRGPTEVTRGAARSALCARGQQCVGGRQERGGDPQVHRIRTYTGTSCRGSAEVLHGAFQSVSELPFTRQPITRHLTKS